MLSTVKKSIRYSYYLSQLWKSKKTVNKDKTAILMYHGVTTEDINLWTQIHVENFRTQMEIIKHVYNPISLAELLECRKHNKPLPEYSVVVTFDDGFKNNFTTAYPILMELKIPATVFVTVSFVDNTGKFEGYIWTDYILMLLIETNDQYFTDTDIGISKRSIKTLQQKIRVKELITSQLKTKPFKEKEAYISKLKERMSIHSVAHNHPILSGMNWDELKTFAEDELITVGAHTINHPILAWLDDTAIEEEIIGSKMILEQKTGAKIDLFAYPNGRPQDYNEHAIATVKKHFKGAVSTIGGLSSPNDDIYQLRRIPVGNDTKLWQFKLHLAGVYDT